MWLFCVCCGDSEWKGQPGNRKNLLLQPPLLSSLQLRTPTVPSWVVTAPTHSAVILVKTDAVCVSIWKVSSSVFKVIIGLEAYTTLFGYAPSKVSLYLRECAYICAGMHVHVC